MINRCATDTAQESDHEETVGPHSNAQESSYVTNATVDEEGFVDVAKRPFNYRRATEYYEEMSENYPLEHLSTGH